jgi:hypothetical protein
MPVHKIVVSNRALLQRKHPTTFVPRLQPAIDAYIQADVARGLDTRLVWLDDVDSMRALGTDPVATPAAGTPLGPDVQRDFKRAIDDVYRKLRPHYVVLLGAPDVVPHQHLVNPVQGVDPDDDLPSDLPYACSAPYSVDPGDFTAPDRAVGRLPDVVGMHDGTFGAAFEALLRRAAAAAPSGADAYADVLGITARTWQDSTRAMAGRLFAPSTVLKVSPTEGWKWTQAEMERRLHFINCHGFQDRDYFVGDDAGVLAEPAHKAEWVRQFAKPDTVVSAECCYSAQLFDPVKLGAPAAGQTPMLGIVYEYLHAGAHCVFGSTTYAYGWEPQSPQPMAHADNLCTEFVRLVLSGQSTGAATLLARQAYARTWMADREHLDPLDVKTLAQFMLVGDPSIRPIGGDVPDTTFALARRTARRRRATIEADALRRTTAVATGEIREPLSAPAQAAIGDLARRFGIATPEVHRYRIGRAGVRRAASAGVSYVITAGPRTGSSVGRVVTALEVDGQFTHVRVAHGK